VYHVPKFSSSAAHSFISFCGAPYDNSAPLAPRNTDSARIFRAERKQTWSEGKPACQRESPKAIVIHQLRTVGHIPHNGDGLIPTTWPKTFTA
jgi:hypothetical protein